MGFIRSCVWMAMAVGLGIALATVEVGGRTPWQHARSAWRTSEAGDWLRDRADDAVDRAKGALGQPQKPRERHTDEDRAALDRIIAKRSNR
jgi:hypothetical protein